MSDRKALSDSNETPEDVATLYSWANLHGAKYRDFSASRAQTREKARQRMEDAVEAERHRVQQEAEVQKIAEMQRAAEIQRHAEQHIRERAEQEAAERAALLQQAAQQRAVAPPQPHYAPPPAPSALPAGGYGAPAYYPAPAPYMGPQAPQPPYSTYAQPAPPMAPPREAPFQPSRPWSPAEQQESTARPAWLAADRNDLPPAPVQHAPADTLQGSRDRITSRWFALKGVFAGGVAAAAEPLPSPPISRAPVLAVFSLAGGVGKTSLVATLGRALSARGERVLLVDTAVFGLLPFFFGARDQRAGVLRTFTAPGNSGDAPVQLLTVDSENLGPEAPGQDALSQEIAHHGHGASRVLIDLATASGAVTRRVLRMNPTLLIPVIADMGSVVSVSSIESFFQRNIGPSGHPVMPFYVMNQFDPSLPLHLDVREVLREQLGDRLLPFSLRRTPAVSEALAEGMTVVDYAPNSTVAEDFGALAGWVKSLAAPASSGFRGVRWSER
jgi:cellulose synthase operon protein YhjQ